MFSPPADPVDSIQNIYFFHFHNCHLVWAIVMSCPDHCSCLLTKSSFHYCFLQAFLNTAASLILLNQIWLCLSSLQKPTMASNFSEKSDSSYELHSLSHSPSTLLPCDHVSLFILHSHTDSWLVLEHSRQNPTLEPFVLAILLPGILFPYSSGLPWPPYLKLLWSLYSDLGWHVTGTGNNLWLGGLKSHSDLSLSTSLDLK